MVAYFDVHLLKCTGQSKDFATELPNFCYAGYTGLEVIGMLRDREKRGVRPSLHEIIQTTEDFSIGSGRCDKDMLRRELDTVQLH
jgi:hypothetical protein